MNDSAAIKKKPSTVIQDMRDYGIDRVESDAEPLLPYIVGVLSDKPVLPPTCSRDQWFSLFALLGKQSIPLLYWKIRALPPDFAPPLQVLEWMRVQFMTSRVRSLCVGRQLFELMSLFRSGGVRTLVLKGAAFAQTIYEEPALRYSDDIDILVHPDDFFRAWELLEESGYKQALEQFDPANKTHIEPWFSYYDRSKKYLPLELHRNLYYCLRFSGEADIQDFFDQAVRVEGPDYAFYTLNPVDTLIYASLHLTLHHSHMFRLIWVYDIALLAKALAHTSDWTRLQTHSVDMHARLAVERCLRLTRAWTGLEPPVGFDDFSTWPRAGALEEDMLDHALNWKSSTVSTFAFFWPTASGFGDKARYLFRTLFPSLQTMKVTHPPPRKWLLPMSYMKRWAKWIHRIKG